MSIKKLRKRIAVIAVSALTAGVISAVAAPVANAATADVTASSLWLATTNSTTGSQIVTASGGDTALDKGTGFVSVSSANIAVNGTNPAQVIQGIGTGVQFSRVGTANALATSKLVFHAAGGAAADRVSLVATNGTISGVTSARILLGEIQTINTGDIVEVTTAAAHGLQVGDIITVDAANNKADATAVAVTVVSSATVFRYVGTAALDADVAKTADAGFFTVALTYDGNATAVVRSNGQNPVIAGIVTPGFNVTTMTVAAYKGASLSTTAPTNGTLIGQWVITIVASSLAGAYSAADSSLYQQAEQAKGTACTGTTGYDVVASIGNNKVGCIWINPKDAYGTAVSAGSLTASATNGFKVAIGQSPTGAEGYTASTSFASVTSNANTYVTVSQGTANTGGSTVVTIAWQGVVIGTKTLTFQGDIAKLTFVAASSNTTYKNGAAATDAKRGIVWQATDALGQVVDLVAANVSISDATGAMTPAVLNNAGGDGTSWLTQSPATGFGAGTMTIATNALVGAGTYRLKVTNAAGADIKSDVINATVSGGAATFTASWDKASYVPGEVAELTITAKDSGGRGLAQGIAFGTGAAITVNTDGLTNLTAACASLDTATVVTAAGSRVCKFAVKNTAGSYSYSVAVPTSTSQSAITGSVKITTSDVSNAEVLKSIVALIASINKQIAALQKLILRR